MVTHFTFRLQRLLDLRERHVQDCQKRLAQSLIAALKAQADLQSLQAERQLLTQNWHECIRREMRPDTALHYQHCFDTLAHVCERANKILVAAQSEELAHRALLDQALRKQKVLEKVCERMRARFLLESNRREQAQLDEFAMLRTSQEAR